MKMQIICPTLILTYCLLLCSVIEAFGSAKGLTMEELDLTFHIIAGKFIPGKAADNSSQVAAGTIEKCTKYLVDNGFKVGILFRDGKCQPVSTKKGDEILCSCGDHVGNYTLDSPTTKTRKIKSKEESRADDIDDWLKSEACDMIEKTEFEYRCKKFEYHPDALMFFKRELKK